MSRTNFSVTKYIDIVLIRCEEFHNILLENVSLNHVLLINFRALP